MGNSNSLSGFFDKTDPATLEDCDREQIHLTGQIQNVGALLVVEPDTGKILGASANLAEILGFDPNRLLHSNLSDLSADLSAQFIATTDTSKTTQHEFLDCHFEHLGTHYDVITHHHAGRGIIEFVPNDDPKAQLARKRMRFCSNACTRIMQSQSWDEALQTGTDAVSEIVGFSRSMIMQFQEDNAGEIVAETLTGELPSYLGLCFPEFDIPKQAREMFKFVRCRAVGTVRDEDSIPVHVAPGVEGELDLTWSVLRSVSTMHNEYLRNMGTEATFVCSLQSKGELWGLISLHNHTPSFVPFDSWSLVSEVGSALMLRFAQEQNEESAGMILKLRQIESSFASKLRREGDVETVLSKLVPALQGFLGADGFAFQHGSNVHVAGRTPPKEFIRELIARATKNFGEGDQYYTNALSQDWPEAAEHIDTACGVLVQPLKMHRVCQLVWFRGPVTKTIKWAGRLDAAKPRGLGPRKSFEIWEEERKDKSAPWREAELLSAREIFQEFLDIIAGQVLLKEENTNLRKFNSTAAHDLKAPIRSISMALNWMREDGFSAEAIKETHALAERSTRRTSDLLDKLIEIAVIDDQSHAFEQVDLARIISDIQDMLAPQLLDAGATVDVGPMLSVQGNDHLLMRLFLNLMSNSLKYRDKKRPLEMAISCTAKAKGMVEFVVSDNGMGIPAEMADRIFLPLERMVSKDEIEGTGLGLTICTRIVSIHNGTIKLDTTHQKGARFVIQLPLRQVKSE